jgi:hypothetical protein
MTDQLVTKETATLAKLKGFNGKCFAGYDEGITNPLWLHSDGKFESLSYRDKSTVMENCVLVPTQALLLKWLRDKKSLHVEIKPWKSKDDTVTWHSQVFTLTRFNVTFQSFEYVTMFCFAKEYEEALEKGLVAALNLLKDI